MVRKKSPSATPDQQDDVQKERKPRGRAASRPFPHQSFEEALELASAIQRLAGSNAVRRLTLFHELNKSPESGPSRQMVVSAGRYGLIKGGVQSETLQLTPDGDVATSSDASLRERQRSRIKLAIDTTEIFNKLYQQLQGQKLPSPAIMEDSVVALDLPEQNKKECVELFVINLRFVGLLQTLSGAERILTVDHALDQIPSTSNRTFSTAEKSFDSKPLVIHSEAHFDRLCFFIGPIGEAGSEFRQHSDLMLETLVRPALEGFGIDVKRADEIQDPGIITKQIFEYLLKARLVVANLSYHNPNVFYELAIRHARNLPVVQMIRKADRIPFDVNQTRTIVVDTTDLYTFVPKIDTYKAEISSHIRRALEDPNSADNPFSALVGDTASAKAD